MIIEIPGVGNVEFPDDMPMDQITAALSQYRTQEPVTQNPDGTYGQPPEGFVMNPNTGQMEDLRSPNNPNIPFVGIPETRERVETATDAQGRGIHGAVTDTVGKGAAGALAIGAGQGLGFEGFDETVAGMSSMLGGDYGYDLARVREADRRAKEYYPGAYYGGKVPGAIASSVTAGKALGINPQGANLLGTMGRGAGIGAGEGALWGFLEGEGAGNRAKNAIATALMGAGVGGAAPGVVAAGAKAARTVGDLVGGGFDAAVGRANSGRANRAIMDTLRKAGLSVDDVADDVARAAREGQPEFRLMDAAGKAGQRRASGVVRAGGDGAEEIAQFLETRQLGQPERLGAFIDDAFGMGGKTAANESAALNAARKATNDVNYAAARQAAGPVNLNNAIDTIDTLMKRNPILGEAALSNTEMGGRLARLRGQLTDDGAQLIDFDTVLNVKEDLGRVIGVIKRSGGDVPRDLAQVYGALDSALENSSDAYRAANDTALAGRKVVGAVDEGAAMSRPSARSADTIPAFRSMTPDEQSAARIGYGDKALAKLEANASPTANKAKALTSPKVAAETDAMALDPRLLKDRVTRETAMWETQNRALGGSRTADNLQDVADVGMMADLGRAAKTALTRPLDAAGTLLARAGAAASGQNEATRTLIAKMLMSDNPKQALAQALRQETTSQGRRRIVEAMTRALGREFIPTP